jgi:carboxylate-amine ligase
VQSIEFNPSPEPTIGVELELQLLDSKTLRFANVAPAVLDAIPPAYRGRIKEEFIQSMVEINTRICRDVEEVDRNLRESLSALEAVLDGMGAVYYSASLHPHEKGTGENLTSKPRYARIMDDLKLVGRRFITQGMHVHVGVKSAERAIRINNTIRMYLPLLLALSTSSPFYGGEDSGLFSYRTKLFEALPLAGLPDSLGDWNEFHRMAQLLQSGGIIDSVKDLWWDVRPHPEFGTVEVRICDIPCRYREILALAALVQSLVVTISNIHVHPDTRVQMQILKSNKWQAARYGLDGVFVNPITAKRVPIREAIHELLGLVREEAEALGGLEYMGEIDAILNHGTGAHLQKTIHASCGDFGKMINRVREGFFQ